MRSTGALSLVLFEIVCVFNFNAVAIEKVPHSHVDALVAVPTQKQSQTRHFDWQKHDGSAPIMEKEEDYNMAPIYEMTAAPIIVSTTTAPTIHTDVEMLPNVSDMPEMALSEFRAPEQVGDVGSILWGAAPPATATSTMASLIQHSRTQPADDEVEVFHGRDPRRLQKEVSSPKPITPKINADAEVVDVDALLAPTTWRPSTFHLKSTTMASTTTTGPTMPTTTTKSTTTTKTTPSKQSTTTEFYSAEETTMHQHSEARDLLGPPAKLRVPAADETLATTVSPSSMDKIMAAMPSIDEDMIRTYTLKNKERYGHGHAKPRIITQELNKMNFTKFDEQHSQPIDSVPTNNNNTNNRSEVESTTPVIRTHREMSISMVAGRKWIESNIFSSSRKIHIYRISPLFISINYS